MADEATPTTEQTVAETTTAQSPAVAKNTETPAESMIPKSRFDEVNNRLKELEKQATEKELARKAEDEKKLAENAEWQKLAEKRKEAADELKPKAELADKLSELVLAQYEAEIENWPEEVRKMAPGDEASVLTKLDWMNKAKPLAVALLADKPPVAGNPRKPTPVGAATVAKEKEATLTTWEQKAARRYR